MDVTIYTHRTGNMSLHFFERPTSAPTVVLLPETDDGRRHPVISPERGGPNYRVQTPTGWAIAGPASLRHESGIELNATDVLELAEAGRDGFSLTK